MVINIKNRRKKISKVDYRKRVLLISYCLRPSKKCPAAVKKDGLNCINCKNNCAIGQLKKAAEELNYKGVCIAPGGSLAIRFIQETEPDGIIAVACHKELIEGVCAVKRINKEAKKKMGKDKKDGKGINARTTIIEAVPLTREGCVDTEVDIEQALEMIRSLEP